MNKAECESIFRSDISIYGNVFLAFSLAPLLSNRKIPLLRKVQEEQRLDFLLQNGSIAQMFSPSWALLTYAILVEFTFDCHGQHHRMTEAGREVNSTRIGHTVILTVTVRGEFNKNGI